MWVRGAKLRVSPAVCWRSVARRGHHGQREPGTGHPCGRPHLPPAFPAAPNRRWPPPTLPPGANPTPRPAAVAGPRRDLLHPAPPDQAGTGRGRHQGVPVYRPVPPDHRRGVDVGPQHRAGHGDPPEHRLPVPDGPVLHLRPLAGYPLLGRPAPVDGLPHVGRRSRSRLLRPAPRSDRARVGRGCPGLHLEPVPDRLPGPHLRHRHAMGGLGLDDRAHGYGGSTGRVALPCCVCRRGGPRRGGERHLDPVGIARACPVAPLRGVGNP